MACRNISLCVYVKNPGASSEAFWGGPDNLLVRVRERGIASAQEVTGRVTNDRATSCGLRPPGQRVVRATLRKTSRSKLRRIRPKRLNQECSAAVINHRQTSCQPRRHLGLGRGEFPRELIVLRLENRVLLRKRRALVFEIVKIMPA